MNYYNLMDNTYIMFDMAFMQQAKAISEKLNIKTISYISYEKESETHEWLTREFLSKAITRLIIPLSLQSNETDGLNIALHIRLNYQLPIEQRLIPIIIVSNLTLDNIATKCVFDIDNNPQSLLFTQGLSVSSTDVDEIVEKLSSTEPLLPEEYPTFLKKLAVNRKATSGHHDIANAWGCFKLSQVVGYDITSPKIKDYLGQMYTKWLICQNNAFAKTITESIAASPIPCKNKRILYIDDKADEGWGELMQYIFKDAGDGFVYVDPSKYKTHGFDFESFQNECESYIGQKWDLVLIDLRLNPDVEDVDNTDIAPTELSGYKLIEGFLEYNSGYQIIVFTASNKIWNVDAAIQRGARGYYIKESPSFAQSIIDTKALYEKNFIVKVKQCFRDCYLYDIFEKKYEMGEGLPKDEFGNELYGQLEIAYELISTAKTDEQFAYAYVSLYMVIEIINKYLVSNQGNRWILPSGIQLHAIVFNKRNNRYEDFGKYEKEEVPSQRQRITGLIKQEWKMSNWQNLSMELHSYIHKRNGFVHKDEAILDEKCIDKNGDVKYLNHDIFSHVAFVNLLNCLYGIIPRLYMKKVD